MNNRRQLMILGCLLPASALALSDQYWQKDPEVKQFITQTARQHHLPAQSIEQTLNHAKLNPKVIKLMRHPYESKPWYQYRQFFVKPQRIDQGVKVWKKHHHALKTITRRTGVPAEIMLAIVGMESNFGHNVGQFNALDTLATLAFSYPPRALYFRYELAQLLLLGHEQKLDVTHLKSSYAGALGMPQFMPSSYRRFATDIDGDGVVDLFHSPSDSFASIGHFLKHYGWRANKPITQVIALDEHTLPKGLRKGELFSPQMLNPRAKQHNHWYIMMDDKDRHVFWRVHDNYRAILHYNNSAAYALAVTELATAIRQRYEHETRT